MGILRDTVGGLVLDSVLAIAPIQSGPVQVGAVPENPSNQKVLFNEPNQPFHLTLGEGMTGLAELGSEADGFHKGLVILLPNGISLEVPVEDHTFHIVSQNVLGNSHVGKAVDHADKQVFLSGIGKELHIPLTTVVTEHGKAGHLVLAAVVVHHILSELGEIHDELVEIKVALEQKPLEGLTDTVEDIASKPEELNRILHEKGNNGP